MIGEARGGKRVGSSNVENGNVIEKPGFEFILVNAGVAVLVVRGLVFTRTGGAVGFVLIIEFDGAAKDVGDGFEIRGGGVLLTGGGADVLFENIVGKGDTLAPGILNSGEIPCEGKL